MKKSIYVLSFLLILGFTASLKSQTDQSLFKIVNKFQLGGEGGWDYLISEDNTGRIFVSHGTTVLIVDGNDGKILSTISDLKGVHGIALAPDLNKGYISEGRGNSVTIFDLKNLKVLMQLSISGQNPDAILYDKFSQKVFTFNGRSKNSTVIDAKTDKVLDSIKLDGKPEFSASDGKGYIYVNIEDKNLISKINSKTLKVEKTWSISPGEEPSGLALDIKNNRLFSVCGNKLMIVSDAKTGKVVSKLPIGSGTDGVAFDPDKQLIFSSNGEGTITVVKQENKDKYIVVETATSQRGARTIAVNAKTHHLYLPTAEFEAGTPEPGKRPKMKPNTFMLLDVASVK